MKNSTTKLRPLISKIERKLIFIFLIFLSASFHSHQLFSQTWTQLGAGAGGQERAVYVYNNPSTGKYDFYVGSDVSGVWCALNVDPNKVNDIAQYNWKYISNIELTRYINKFTPIFSSLDLLVGYRNGIGVISLNTVAPAMASAWFKEESWVSDMHVAANQVYFTTGTTRVSDESANFKDVDNTDDLYIATFNPSNKKINVTSSYDLPQLRGDKNVYCLHVEDNAAGLADDSYLIGSDAGLYVFNYSQLQNIPSPVLGPFRSMNYKVTSILGTNTPNEYLITVNNVGLFKYNAATKQWTDLINKLQGIDGIFNQSTYNYRDFKNDQSVQGFTKLIFVPGANPGWILMNENNLVDYEGKNYYVGAFYTSDNNGTPNNEWTALNVDFGQNDWGWNNSTPCSNINGTLLMPNNYLMVGKSGNLFVTANPIVTSGTLNPLIVTWQQIYTKEQQLVGGCSQYKHRGYVNTAPKCVFNDNKNNLWVGMHDRLMWVAEGGSDYFKEVTANQTSPNCTYSINTSITSNTDCPTSGINITDCFHITNNPNIPNDLYACIGSGYATSKGPGFVVKLGSNNVWQPVGLNYFCGDPVKLIFSNSDMYVLVDLLSGGSSLYWYNASTSMWVAVSFANSPTDFKIKDVLISRDGSRIFALNGNNDAIYSFEKNMNPVDFTANANSFNTGVTNVKCKQMALLELPEWSGDYKLIVGTEPKNYSLTYDNLFLLNSDLTTPTALTNGVDFNKLYIDNVDNTDGGINFIDVNPISKTVYISTVYYDGSVPVAKLYKAPIDVTYKTIQNSSWIDITGTMPNKAVKYICSNGASCGNEVIYCAMRGLGIWKLNVNAGDASITVTKSVCKNAQNGKLTATTPTSWSGGTVSYLWSNGSTMQTATGLAPGTYTVTVTTTAGCSGQAATYTQSYTLEAMDFYILKTNTCSSLASGTAKVIDNGVKLPLTYLWSTGATTPTVSGLSSNNTYTVSVSDYLGGCTVTKTIAINQSTVSATATITSSACTGTPVGVIAINNTSTLCALPFQYKLNALPYQLSNVFNNVAAATYSVTLVDNNGCSASINATVGSALDYTGQPIAGTYTLNSSLSVSSNNLHLSGFTFYVANSSSTITVYSGYTLTLDAGTIFQACSGSWGGIILKSGATLVMDDATIKDAGTFAITAEAGSTLQIKNCSFDNNKSAVLYQSGSYTGSYICGTTFNYTKIPEFAYNSIAQHIKIDNATNVVIGTDYTSTISKPNVFTHAMKGIGISNSDAVICNSNFSKIGFDESEEPGVIIRYGDGIIANNNIVTKSITVGKYNANGTYWPACSFDNIINGVVLNGLTNSTVSDNNFDFCSIAVSFLDNTIATNTIQVTANNFNNFITGISSASNKAVCTFSNNLFNMKLTNTPLKYYQTIVYGSAAISVRNTNVLGSYITADGNRINNSAIGIYFIGVKTNVLGNVNIGAGTSNHIWFNVPEAQITTPHRGVSLVNCKNISVVNNDIEWDYTPTATVLNTIKGIELKATISSDIKENTITSMAAGVAVFGDCTGSKLLCNKMYACYHGVYLNPNSPTSLLSAQGDIGTGSSFDNKWTNNINFKVGGTIWLNHKIEWVYVQSAGADYSPIGSANFVLPQLGSIHSTCVTPQFMDAQERSLMFGDAVGDSTATDGDALEFIITDKETFYKQAKQDTSILTMGVATDASFHEAFDSLKQSNVGQYEAVTDSLAAGKKETALQMLALISDENAIDENKKYVSSVLAVNYSPLSDTDGDTILVLTNIANTHPFYGGEAVYWARAILNLDVADVLPPMRKAHSNNQSLLSTPVSEHETLIPNPAFGGVSFIGIQAFGINDVLTIFNGLLQKNMEYKLPMGQLQFSFDVSTLQQGIYFVKHSSDKSIISESKLVIIK